MIMSMADRLIVGTKKGDSQMRKLTAEENDWLYRDGITILKAFTNSISILSGQECTYDLLYNGNCAIFLGGQRCFYGTSSEAYTWLNEKVESYYKEV